MGVGDADKILAGDSSVTDVNGDDLWNRRHK